MEVKCFTQIGCERQQWMDDSMHVGSILLSRAALLPHLLTAKNSVSVNL